MHSPGKGVAGEDEGALLCPVPPGIDAAVALDTDVTGREGRDSSQETTKEVRQEGGGP